MGQIRIRERLVAGRAKRVVVSRRWTTAHAAQKHPAGTSEGYLSGTDLRCTGGMMHYEPQ